LSIEKNKVEQSARREEQSRERKKEGKDWNWKHRYDMNVTMENPFELVVVAIAMMQLHTQREYIRKKERA
jgi:hypothetical protein